MGHCFRGGAASRAACSLQAPRQRRVRERQDAEREMRRVARPPRTHAERADRDPGRHLHGRRAARRSRRAASWRAARRAPAAGECAAIAPARCAAPPAPAMITSRPRAARAPRPLGGGVRRAVRGAHRDLARDSELRSTCAASSIIGTVRLAAHHDADTRARFHRHAFTLSAPVPALPMPERHSGPARPRCRDGSASRRPPSRSIAP